MTPYIRKFRDCDEYTQECGPNCEFRALLPKGLIGDLGAGLVTMKGPTWNVMARHDGWQQVYLVLSGEGTMVIDGRKYPVSGPTVIQIPFNTDHAMELAEGQEMQYVYVNQFLPAATADASRNTGAEKR